MQNTQDVAPSATQPIAHMFAIGLTFADGAVNETFFLDWTEVNAGGDTSYISSRYWTLEKDHKAREAHVVVYDDNDEAIDRLRVALAEQRRISDAQVTVFRRDIMPTVVHVEVWDL